MAILTKDIRDKIAHKAARASFEPKNADLVKRENKLAIECYNFLFPKKLRDILAKVPPEWLRTCSCLRFNANGWRVNLRAGKAMPTPASYNCSLLGVVSGDLAQKVQDFAQEKTTLENDYKGALAKLRGFLEQFKTFKKLEEAWPEGKKFYKEFNVDRPSANVPAVITKEINALLGLTEKAA